MIYNYFCLNMFITQRFEVAMITIPFIGYNLYQMFLIFCFWSFIGWGIEVVYMTIETGEFQNRGFLNMPFCPIYGFGVLAVVTFTRPIAGSPLLLFVLSAVVCTALELLVGIGLEKIFHNIWWDYSHERFNYKGYICLKVTLLWGMGCLIVVKIVHPIVEKIINAIPFKVGIGFIITMSLLLIIDIISSVSDVENLNKYLRKIDEISKLMVASSVMIGENLSNETLDLVEKYNHLVEQAANAQGRLIRAFPYLKSSAYSNAMETIKRKFFGDKKYESIADQLEVRKKQIHVMHDDDDNER